MKTNKKSQSEKDTEMINSKSISKIAVKIEHDFPLDRWESCAYLGVSKRMLEELTLRGELKAIKLGRRVLYSGHELRNYIQQLSASVN